RRTPLRLGLLFARAEEVQVKGCWLGCPLGPARGPVFCLNNITAEQQPVCWPAAAVPLGRALKVAGVFAQPIKIGVKTCDQSFEAGAEARIFYLWVFVEKDVIEVPQAWRRARALQRSAVNRQDALAQSCRLLHLPGANFGTRRCLREHEN